MKVAEIFTSINGEGQRAGELAAFIRFAGCNLCCDYCDTKWVNEKDVPFKEMTPEEILSYIRVTGITNVTLTGGEPFLQDEKDMRRLLKMIAEDKIYRVEVETNGSIDLSPYCGGPGRPVFTMDWKLPSSGCEKSMLPANLELLARQDTLKFVAGTEEDLERAEELIIQHHLTKRCRVYFSPVFGQIEPERMVRFLIEKKLNEVRLQLQLHKIIWDPDRRGV